MDHAQSQTPHEPSEAGASPPDARIEAVEAWLGHFSRTIKTCRLYNAVNPTTTKFREDLGAQLVALLESHGPFTLAFSAQDVRCDEHVVLTARSREDNFAMPFYRDGLRTLTFQPGMDARQMDTLLDLILGATSRVNNGSEDMVTLLWDADLPFVDMTYVSSETDADLESEAEASQASAAPGAAPPGNPLPWPGAATPPGAAASAPESAPVPAAATSPGGPESAAPVLAPRSEDWTSGDPIGDLEQHFLQLEASPEEDLASFARTLAEGRQVHVLNGTLDLAREVLRSGILDADRADLENLLARALYDSIAASNWANARATVEVLTDLAGGAWDASRLVASLTQPDSPLTPMVARHLDESGLNEVQECGAFARLLGPPAVEWLMGIVALSEQQRTRRTLVRLIGGMSDGRAEQLAPWLGDERWYVVRNAVVALASSEGETPVGLLRPLVKHPEMRVRQEVVAALANADFDRARPLLLEMLRDLEPVIRHAAMHRLGSRRDPEVAEVLLAIVKDASFRKQTAEEVRAVTSALGGCAGDEALPHLEEQLHGPRWFDDSAAHFYPAIARCIGRIGTPAAIAVLERNAGSRSGATRDACKLVLKGIRHD